MKQGSRLLVFIAAVVLPLLWGGHVLAAPASLNDPFSNAIGREIKVTAIVPSHRDIIIDFTGRIMNITSNTSEDVTPEVYMLTTSTQSSRPLTPQLYAAYRHIVPVGSTTYGVLYNGGVARSGVTQPRIVADVTR